MSLCSQCELRCKDILCSSSIHLYKQARNNLEKEFLALCACVEVLADYYMTNTDSVFTATSVQDVAETQEKQGLKEECIEFYDKASIHFTLLLWVTIILPACSLNQTPDTKDMFASFQLHCQLPTVKDVQ